MQGMMTTAQADGSGRVFRDDDSGACMSFASFIACCFIHLCFVCWVVSAGEEIVCWWVDTRD